MPVATAPAPRLRVRLGALVTLAALLGAVGPIAGPLSAQDPADSPPLEPGPPAPVAISVEEAGLLVVGLSPGGEGVVFGVTRERLPYFWHQFSVHDVVSADATGVAAWAPPASEATDVEPEPPSETRTVWVAADGASGRFAIAASPGFTPVEVAFPARGISRAPNGLLRVLKSRFGRAEMLLLRPGVGAWRMVAVDGAASDADRSQDSAASLSLDAALPVWSPGGEEPVLDELAAGDVVVVVSLQDLRYFAVTLTAPGPEA